MRTVDGIPVFSESDAYVANYDQIARDHLDHLARTRNSPFMVDHQIQQSEAITLGMVRRHLPAGARILDAGVGIGNLLRSVPTYDRYGVDIALEYLKVAQQQGLTVAMAKLAELPYVDHYFDGVVICDVLEHLIDIDISIAQIVRVLKSSGVLIVRVPNNEDLSSYVADDRYSYVHVRTFTRDSLRLYLEKCFNFKFLESAYAAESFYAASQLLNPAPALGAAIRAVLPPLAKAAEENSAPYTAEVQSLGKGLALSLEEQVDALILLRDQYPEVFAKLAKAVVRPAELVGVFRAPQS
jgi:2-polyprenyl-3-methyl-5-hydroxy-6-metoxy-1,4-benzoquinol methylase